MPMQAFGGPWGPVVAPEMPTGTDVTTPYLTGVQLAMQNNARQRALEMQAQSYALRSENEYYLRQQQAQKFQQQQTVDQWHHEAAMDKSSRDYDRLLQLKDYQDNQVSLRAQREQDLRNNAQNRLDAQEKAKDAMASAGNQLANLALNPDTKPGTPQYPYLAQKIATNNDLASKDQLALRSQVATAHNVAHNQDVQNYKMMKQQLDDDVGNTLGYDKNLRPDYTGVFNPAALPANYTGWNTIDPSGAKKITKALQSGTQDVVVPYSQLTDFNKRWQDVSAKFNSLTQTGMVNDPQAGVTAATDMDPVFVQRYKKAQAVWSNPAYINSPDPNIQRAREAAGRVLYGMPSGQGQDQTP